MIDSLEDAFSSYATAVQSVLTVRKEKGARGHLRLIPNNDVRQLNDLVDELEGRTEFVQLVQRTRSSYYGDDHRGDESLWVREVQDFFRRSGFYTDIFEGRSADPAVFYQRYQEAFTRREFRTYCLAPLEGVRFAEPFMDFGSFQVQQFSAQELKDILQDEVNSYFWPSAGVDVGALADYWFLHLSDVALIPRPSRRIPANLSEIDRVRVKFTDYPQIKSVLRHLVLYDWQTDRWGVTPVGRPVMKARDLKRGWQGFAIPFVLRVDDNLLGYPRKAPDLSALRTDLLTDPETGDLFKTREVWIDLDLDETDSFKTLLIRIKGLLDSLSSTNHVWPFIDVALDFLLKAFFAEGLEQLLWHITVLEALLGKKGDRWERIRDRLASLLGKTGKELQAFKREFGELYNFRGNLVHGNTEVVIDEVFVGHLRRARSLARSSLVWFLHFLNHIREALPIDTPEQNIPTREDILTLLDLDESSRARLGMLVGIIPPDFPHVPQWLN